MCRSHPRAVLAWDACSFPDAPVVGTFHAYSTKAGPNRIANVLGAQRKFNQLHERIAVSEAAAWTGRRWYGGTLRDRPQRSRPGNRRRRRARAGPR